MTQNSQPRRGPERDAKYLAWIRTLPCAVRNCLTLIPMDKRYFSKVEAAHTGGHGLSQKASDYSAIPLCRWHHQIAPDSNSACAKKFYVRYKINLSKLKSTLRQRYQKEAA